MYRVDLCVECLLTPFPGFCLSLCLSENASRSDLQSPASLFQPFASPRSRSQEAHKGTLPVEFYGRGARLTRFMRVTRPWLPTLSLPIYERPNRPRRDEVHALRVFIKFQKNLSYKLYTAIVYEPGIFYCSLSLYT